MTSLLVLRNVGDYFADVALLWPGALLAAILGLALAIPVARALGTWRWSAALLVFSLGLIAAATLTPSREALEVGEVSTGTCDFSRVRIATIAELLQLDDPGFNLLLFLPLGIAIGLIRRRRVRFALAVASIGLSPAIELIQLVAVQLDRACQTSDIFDNLTGLVLGFVIGTLVGVAIRWVAAEEPPDAAPDAPNATGSPGSPRSGS